VCLLFAHNIQTVFADVCYLQFSKAFPGGKQSLLSLLKPPSSAASPPPGADFLKVLSDDQLTVFGSLLSGIGSWFQGQFDQWSSTQIDVIDAVRKGGAMRIERRMNQ
jgi:hypothetical protein